MGIITGADNFVAADIEESITLEGQISATLSVENIRATTNIVKVWALITPPAEAAAMQPHGKQEPFSLPELYLLPEGNGNYSWMYSGFDVAGTYYADYYLLDSEGLVLSLGRTTIIQSIEPDLSSASVVQGESDVVTAHVPANEEITLKLTTALDPEIRKNVVHEWLLVALGTADGEIRFYLFSPSGMVDLPIGSGAFANYTFPYDHSREQTTLATLSPGSIGLGVGDFLACAYVYTVRKGINDIFGPGVVYHNSVIVFVE